MRDRPVLGGGLDGLGGLGFNAEARRRGGRRGERFERLGFGVGGPAGARRERRVIDLGFRVVDARTEAHTAAPSLAFRLAIKASEPVHAILLRAQVQIEPRRRGHTASEQERLADVFGESERWRDTLHPLIWARASVSVPAFEDGVEIDLPVACTYDFEVAAAKYLDALEGGEAPLLFLFSGTVFAKAANGFRVEQIGWDKEAAYRLPVAVWREAMDAHFPGCAWIRVRRESLDALQRFRARNGMTDWDEAIEALIGRAEAAAR